MKWNDAKEKLPKKDGTPCLVIYKNEAGANRYATAVWFYYGDQSSYWCLDVDVNTPFSVAHWIPLKRLNTEEETE